MGESLVSYSCHKNILPTWTLRQHLIAWLFNAFHYYKTKKYISDMLTSKVPVIKWLKFGRGISPYGKSWLHIVEKVQNVDGNYNRSIHLVFEEVMNDHLIFPRPIDPYIYLSHFCLHFWKIYINRRIQHFYIHASNYSLPGLDYHLLVLFCLPNLPYCYMVYVPYLWLVW